MGTGRSVSIDVLANDSDVDGPSLDICDFTQPANGSVVLGSLVYTSALGFVDTDTFTYTAFDRITTSASSTVTVTVTPAVTVTPNAGTVGTVVDVTGAGFAPNELIDQVTYDGAPIATTPAPTTADAHGNWGPLTLTIPPGASGGHAVNASGEVTGRGNVAGDTFTVTPAISIDPSGGPVGTEILVEGTGFGSDETGVEATYDGQVLAGPTQADVDGSWTLVFPAPPSASGLHLVDAFGDVTAAAQVPDQAFNVVASIRLVPGKGPVGFTVAVLGTGYAPNETGIRVTFDGEVVANGALAADAQGS